MNVVRYQRLYSHFTESPCHVKADTSPHRLRFTSPSLCRGAVTASHYRSCFVDRSFLLGAIESERSNPGQLIPYVPYAANHYLTQTRYQDSWQGIEHKSLQNNMSKRFGYHYATNYF
ncbi:hypothetical protein NPIL_43321 [Nephila pilipes]|uniref:Uncharacterized protein n=1 Tax=Nephila pilipes TaxID=299642 RepID=A0A8X6P179_NEPPI|nr:hypothetical protein NPIL_43321 [Nephila pilipes]